MAVGSIGQVSYFQLPPISFSLLCGRPNVRFEVRGFFTWPECLKLI